MDEKISKLFLPLIDKLYNTEPAGEPFRKPVDVVKYGCFDYYLYVKHPIDLSTIRDRLTNHQYNDAWRFVADVQLMFSNAYLFNKKGTPVYEFTNKLNKIWNSELAPIMQRLNYCCGTLHKFGPQLLFCHGTTPDRYCQILIGSKYKCYQDQYCFCIPCFNKIETDHISIQGLTCETVRMKLPTQPVKKSDFIDCTNDNWQYETFIKCTQCSRRVHQICDLYPADEEEINACIQHAQLELEQKLLCQVPEEYRTETNDDNLKPNHQHNHPTTSSSEQQDQPQQESKTTPAVQTSDNVASEIVMPIKNSTKSSNSNNFLQNITVSPTSLDDELLQFARDVEDSHLNNSAPASPSNLDESKSRFDSAKETFHKKTSNQIFNTNCRNQNRSNCSNSNLYALSSSKNSVDKIAARLSSNRVGLENNQSSDDFRKQPEPKTTKNRDKFLCNFCYRRKRVGFDLRHRKYSARRLPHTRMSRYIETKVNEHIRENSPTAGEVTIRVLTAYKDNVEVKEEMREYVKSTKNYHSNLKDYPNEFNYTNRAIFAWQEIDGVDVCVFGMHVQEYGEDCPEPNRLVIYLSYIDSVHFFRPKQVRTAVYHEILLSYFKYVKKLGFRRVYIWVCPSRKGDDYIFYRHPTEQKMPTLKRLSDWYVNLLDKGIMAGIVEKHQNIYQYAMSENWSSILSMPYLSGDYWPGEFERLLKVMIEYKKEYECKLRERQEADRRLSTDISDLNNGNSFSISEIGNNEHTNMLSLSNLYHKRSPNTDSEKKYYSKSSILNSVGLKPVEDIVTLCFKSNTNLNHSLNEESKLYEAFTTEFSKSYDQPLDLSKSSSTTSPESEYYGEDDIISEYSFNTSNNGRKKRRKTTNMGYSKKRSRTNTSMTASQSMRCSRNALSQNESFNRFISQSSHTSRPRFSTQSHKDTIGSEILLDPEEDLSKNLEKSLKRQKDGFIVARLNECDCSPHFESQRRKEENTFTCDLMKGREPFLQLARLKNYEFSTLRRAKFSSLAMIKHLGQYLKLEPICNECFSFDSSKKHYSCPYCDDYYLCTSCHENTQHEHIMSLMAPTSLPDIDEFLQQCSLASASNSISSASSTISNKSFNDSNMDISIQTRAPCKKDLPSSTPLNRHLSNTLPASTMPLSCMRQRNKGFMSSSFNENLENAEFFPLDSSSKITLPNQLSPPPSHSANNVRDINQSPFELDQVIVDNFIRQAEVNYDVDFDSMKGESKKLLTHYWACPMRETCYKCKFVVLSCSFMKVIIRGSRTQPILNRNPSEINSGSNNIHHSSGINLTTTPKIGSKPIEKWNNEDR